MTQTMYEEYWKFRHKPFHYRMETDRLYRSRSVQTALLRLRYCIENNALAAIVAGASGVGKTSLMRILRDEGTSLRPFVHLAVPRLSSLEINRTLTAELSEDESCLQLAADALVVRQHFVLKKLATEGLHPVIALDEAHLMSNDAMNEVVLPLLNLAETDFSLQYTIVLLGQPSLASHIARNPQLRERIAVKAIVDGFTREETQNYIQTCLQSAGRSEPIFTEAAIEEIASLSQGHPRIINRLCDMALLVGFSDHADVIDVNDIRALGSELLPAAA